MFVVILKKNDSKLDRFRKRSHCIICGECNYISFLLVRERRGEEFFEIMMKANTISNIRGLMGYFVGFSCRIVALKYSISSVLHDETQFNHQSSRSFFTNLPNIPQACSMSLGILCTFGALHYRNLSDLSRCMMWYCILHCSICNPC